MRLSATDLSADDLFDVCIIGTGPAGISCALALERSGKRIALLEGGGEEVSDWSQELYKGEVIGDPYFSLDAGRLRYFGGTSNHWGGWCRPLDAIDFKAKGPYTETAWPIAKTDLDPYLEAASEILQIPPVPEDRALPGGGVKQIDFVFSPPVRFARTFGGRIFSSASVFLIADANLLRLETNGADITGARIVNRAGEGRVVRARTYVLATGGIENSRILLWSNAQSGGQVVKNAQTLGRYWMEHPQFTLGEVLAVGDLGFRMSVNRELAFFAPTSTTLERHGILNCGLHVQPVGYVQETKRMIAELACVAPDWARWAARLLGRRLICGGRLSAVWEQEPRAENRVSLGDETDSLGVPRPRLHWRKSEADRRTARLAAEALGTYLAQSDAGRLRLSPWLTDGGDFPTNDALGGHHHMGGTRMADGPASGVVDRDCKVFGQSNLYVAGSSVFPSAGHANPTLSIVQLALRLADHLRPGH